ncbi:MAG TPA: hypothetical protein VEX37_13250 [Thermomicrobiales bacterium]|nr:hypothetical protein [Thermomicrobiales bacterium]
MTQLDLVVFGLALPLTVAVVQILKEAAMPTRYAGLAALATGIAAGLLVRLSGIGTGPIALAALTGAVAGLSAAGVWSGTRALRE